MKQRPTPEQIVRKLRQAGEKSPLGYLDTGGRQGLSINEATGFWFGIVPLPRVKTSPYSPNCRQGVF
jgi:hypothetical protein